MPGVAYLLPASHVNVGWIPTLRVMKHSNQDKLNEASAAALTDIDRKARRLLKSASAFSLLVRTTSRARRFKTVREMRDLGSKNDHVAGFTCPNEAPAVQNAAFRHSF